MEHAPRGQIHRRGHLALKANVIGPVILEFRDGRQQRLGIGMPGRGEQGFGVCQLTHPAQVHDGHPGTEVFYHREIVGNEQVGQTAAFLGIHQQIQHLGLDRHIQGRDGLIGNDKFRVHRQGAGNGNPLALTTGKLVAKATAPVRVDTHRMHDFVNLVPYLNR